MPTSSKVIIPQGSDSSDNDDWMLTYADMVTLLMTFFVLLYTTADTNQEKFQQITESIATHVLHKKAEEVKERPTFIPKASKDPLFSDTMDKLHKMILKEKIQ